MIDEFAVKTVSFIGPTKRSERILEIELLRAVAILIVLVQHLPFNLFFWPARINQWLSGFWVGVDLFFAISGYVIARSLLPKLGASGTTRAFVRVTLEFWIRRAWRLLPSAWLWLLLPLPLCLLFNRSGAFGSLQANWEMLIAGLLELANFRTIEVFGRFGLGTAFAQWSLSLEEQFYLLLPIAVFLLRRRLPLLLLVIAALGFIVPNSAAAFQLRLWPIAFGVLLAIWSDHPTYQDCAPHGLARSPTARGAMLLLPIFCIINVGTQSFHIVSFYQGIVAFLSALLVWVASYDRGYLMRRGRLLDLMAAIAARSYSLYLVHIPAFFTLHEVWFRWHGIGDPTRRQAIIYSALALPVTFGLAELNYRLIETPLRDRGRRIASRFAKEVGA